MKENSKQIFKYSYITAALFLLIVFAVFLLNVYETVYNIKSGNDKGIRAIAADAESVEQIVYPFVNLNGAFQSVMQRDYIYDADPANDTIRKSDGYIVSVPSGYKDKDVAAAAKKLKASSDWLAAKGIPLIYIQAPSKMTVSAEPAMPGIPNHTYAKNEVFRKEAEHLGIEYVAASDWLSGRGSDSDFYRTDHHWTIEACYEVATGICSYLNDKHGFGIDEKLFDSDSYESMTHTKAFLGAEGRRTGIWYAGLDDFTEIIPKFDTDFDIAIIDKEDGTTKRKGSFTEAVMDRTKDVQHYSFEDSAYYEYWGGDYGRIHVINNKLNNGKKVLLFKDSYGVPVTALLTNVFSSMDIIDVRYYNDDKSIRSIIEEEKPDAVIYIYGTGYLSKKKMFTIK